eukprot:2449374-Rhodomonas_salina.1
MGQDKDQESEKELWREGWREEDDQQGQEQEGVLWVGGTSALVASNRSYNASAIRCLVLTLGLSRPQARTCIEEVTLKSKVFSYQRHVRCPVLTVRAVVHRWAEETQVE